jgi:ribosomal protein L18E
LEQKLVTKSKYRIHKIVVGKKDFQATNLVVQAHAFTQAARQAIEEQGGTCQILSKTTHKVVVEEEEKSDDDDDASAADE